VEGDVERRGGCMVEDADLVKNEETSLLFNNLGGVLNARDTTTFRWMT
jgi:hypothetical protein